MASTGLPLKFKIKFFSLTKGNQQLNNNPKMHNHCAPSNF